MTSAVTPIIGKRVRLRDGRVSDPVIANYPHSPYPYVAEVPGSGRRSWDAKGYFSSFAWSNCPADVVEVLP